MSKEQFTVPEEAGAYGTWLAQKLQPVVEAQGPRPAKAKPMTSDITWTNGEHRWKLILIADPEDDQS